MKQRLVAFLMILAVPTLPSCVNLNITEPDGTLISFNAFGGLGGWNRMPDGTLALSYDNTDSFRNLMQTIGSVATIWLYTDWQKAKDAIEGMTQTTALKEATKQAMSADDLAKAISDNATKVDITAIQAAAAIP